MSPPVARLPGLQGRNRYRNVRQTHLLNLWVHRPALPGGRETPRAVGRCLPIATADDRFASRSDPIGGWVAASTFLGTLKNDYGDPPLHHYQGLHSKLPGRNSSLLNTFDSLGGTKWDFSENRQSEGRRETLFRIDPLTRLAARAASLKLHPSWFRWRTSWSNGPAVERRSSRLNDSSR